MPLRSVERRHHQRFKLTPMHSPVTVQCVNRLAIERLEGHAYDLSETGVRLELDQPLEIGQQVAVHLALPGQLSGIFANGLIVWVNDEDDDPGPRRMAIHFTDFLNESDKVKLLRYVGSCADRFAA